MMDGYKDNGRPNLHTFYGKTQKEVRTKMKAFLDARAAGIDMSLKYTFGEWADIWFENHRDNITPTTQESYKYTLRILKDWFGRRKLLDIKPYDVEVFLKELCRRRFSRSLRNGSITT